MKKALTVAGSDSGGGAGIQADLKTMAALNVFGASAVTALTAQNTRGVAGIYPVTPAFLDMQLEAVLSDIGADAVKTGMLFSSELIAVTAAALRRHRTGPLVIDPVMVSKSGHRLLLAEAQEALVAELFPLAMVVTPNIPEASLLCGRDIESLDDMKECAGIIADRGPSAVVIKGGHLRENAADVVWYRRAITVLEGTRLAGDQVHGTGCVFSAALASFLALGSPLEEAVSRAKAFVRRGIAEAVAVGGGYPSVNVAAAGGYGTMVK